MEKKELPFGIEFVINIDLPDIKKYKSGRNSYDIDCPFCNGKRKLNFNTDNNKWRCNKCNEAGNTISLHATLTGTDNKKAYKDLMDRYNGLPSDQKVIYKPEVKKDEIVPGSSLLCSVAYEQLLKLLPLSKKHRDNLIKRGLTDEQIKRFGYKSYPVFGLHYYAQKVNDETRILASIATESERTKSKIQIPGFYGYGKNWKIVHRKNCFFVPVRNQYGYITRMQIRYDDLPEDATESQRENFKRYASWASTEKEEGVSVSGTGNVHWVGFKDIQNTPETVYLTEGALKADIASTLSGWAFISLMGVNSQSQLPEALAYLKKHGTKTIKLAFDADYREKKEVARALDSAKQKIKEAGLEYQILVWDTGDKGIDDYLLSRRQKTLGY